MRLLSPRLTFVLIWIVCAFYAAICSGQSASSSSDAVATEETLSKLSKLKLKLNDVKVPYASAKPILFREAVRLQRSHNYTIEETEAMVFRYLIRSLSGAMTKIIVGTGHAIRVTGDTIASFASSILKTAGGLIQLFWDAVDDVCLPLVTPRAPTDHMPHIFDHVGRKVGRVLRMCASMGMAVGEVRAYAYVD